MSSATNKASSSVLSWTERGLVPDSVIRAGIRRLCRQRLKDIHADDIERSAETLDTFVDMMNASPVALLPEMANEQHYELPPAFFNHVLGAHRKYSCCYWDDKDVSLEVAEAKALELSCTRAGIEDGMSILDLGCGWGSLSLWMAAQYPKSRVTAVSNSAPQRRHIEAQAAQRNLYNLEVLTRDMNDFDSEKRFDRIVSVEMFEHMRNYRRLFGRISTWLKPEGRFFMHIFCHRNCAYEFLDQGPSDWMSRHFFSGGIMPSDNLPLRFQNDLHLLRQWRWDGRHYGHTANAWLANMDARKEAILPILAETYGSDQKERWFQRWRIFFMACAEMFAQDHGQEWYVSHYLFSRAALDAA